MRSLYKFAEEGMIGTIYIVSKAGQRPRWLKKDVKNVVMVDENEIMEGRKTSNSIAIEWMIHRIPNLRDRYIYFNDDFFVLKRISSRDFFDACTGNVVIRREGFFTSFFPYLGPLHTWFKSLGATQAHLTREFGFSLRPYLMHAPYPFVKHIMAEIFAKKSWQEGIQTTLSHQYRTATDIQSSIIFSYWMIHTDRALAPPADENNIMYNTWTDQSYSSLSKEYIEKQDAKFLCLQDPGEGFSYKQAEILEKMRGFMQEYFPDPAPWEI
jgi:hypothetical protein